MSALRSSVHPDKAKLPWGTILKPEFGMGYQKMTGYEVEQTVNRLCVKTEHKQRSYTRNNPSLSQEEIDTMLARLTKVDVKKIPDSDRRLMQSQNKDMGVLSSYAWRGYNTPNNWTPQQLNTPNNWTPTITEHPQQLNTPNNWTPPTTEQHLNFHLITDNFTSWVTLSSHNGTGPSTSVRSCRVFTTETPKLLFTECFVSYTLSTLYDSIVQVTQYLWL